MLPVGDPLKDSARKGKFNLVYSKKLLKELFYLRFKHQEWKSPKQRHKETAKEIVVHYSQTPAPLSLMVLQATYFRKNMYVPELSPTKHTPKIGVPLQESNY